LREREGISPPRSESRDARVSGRELRQKNPGRIDRSLGPGAMYSPAAGTRLARIYAKPVPLPTVNRNSRTEEPEDTGGGSIEKWSGVRPPRIKDADLKAVIAQRDDGGCRITSRARGDSAAVRSSGCDPPPPPRRLNPGRRSTAQAPGEHRVQREQ